MANDGPVFIDVRACEGVQYTGVELIQLTAIGSVRKGFTKHYGGEVSAEIYIYPPRDLEEASVITFESEAARDEFLQKLISMLSRKATVVTV